MNIYQIFPKIIMLDTTHEPFMQPREQSMPPGLQRNGNKFYSHFVNKFR